VHNNLRNVFVNAATNRERFFDRFTSNQLTATERNRRGKTAFFAARRKIVSNKKDAM